MKYGGIEAGGTKFICAVGSNPDDLSDINKFPTTTPDETIGKVIDYFKEEHRKEPLTAIGIGSFGPIDIRKNSSTYGYITSTPKPGWKNTDFAGVIEKKLNLPVFFDTDVNAAGLGEYRWGAAQGLKNFIYLTIGTGIGGGGMMNCKLMHGLSHPEMGHLLIPHDRTKDPFDGCCPFHEDCFEGLASGTAIRERWKIPAEQLPQNHPGWDLESHYISLALVNYIMTLSPQKIILGGGIMEQAHLLPLIRSKTVKLLNNYIHNNLLINEIENFIALPALKNRAGILGSIALAQRIKTLLK